MPHYLVTLQVTVNGYEKETTRLIEADYPLEAERQAILKEAHNAVDVEDIHEGVIDDVFLYHVLDIKTVVDEHVVILTKYLE